MGVGRVYQQTFIDTYAKVGFAKLYDRKTPITAADLLNDRVLPFYDEHDVPLLRILTDRGTEYCGTHDRHEYELYLAVENIDHSRTKTKSPQTNGIVERFHKTILDEFYRVAFRRKIYTTIEELQADLDLWMVEYNELRSHQAATASARSRCRRSLTRHPQHARKLSPPRRSSLTRPPEQTGQPDRPSDRVETSTLERGRAGPAGRRHPSPTMAGLAALHGPGLVRVPR